MDARRPAAEAENRDSGNNFVTEKGKTYLVLFSRVWGLFAVRTDCERPTERCGWPRWLKWLMGLRLEGEFGWFWFGSRVDSPTDPPPAPPPPPPPPASVNELTAANGARDDNIGETAWKPKETSLHCFGFQRFQKRVLLHVSFQAAVESNHGIVEITCLACC